MAAQTKKKNKKTTGKKTVNAKQSAVTTNDPIRSELFAITYIAIAITLLLVLLFANPHDSMTGAGVIGIALAKFFALLCGKARFAVPALLLLLGWFCWKRREPNFPLTRSVIFAIIFFLSVVTFFGVMKDAGTFQEAIANAGEDGGLLGNTLGWLLLTAFQRLISIVILSALILVSLVAMTGISFFGLLRKTGAAGYKAGQNLNEKAREHREERAAQRAAQREQAEAARRAQPIGDMPSIDDDFPKINLATNFDETEALDKASKKITTEALTIQGKEPPEIGKSLDQNFPSFGQHLAASIDAAAPIIEGEDPDLGLMVGAPPAPPSYRPRRTRKSRVTVMDEIDSTGQDEKTMATNSNTPPVIHIEETPQEEPANQLVTATSTEPETTPENGEPTVKPYELPKTTLLKKAEQAHNKDVNRVIHESVEVLENTLASFGVNARVTEVSYGPAITRFEVQPGPGVKVSKIVNLSDDIALQLKSAGIRMEAPVPGKSVIGIEVPRQETSAVSFRDMLENSKFFQLPSKLVCAFGKDISGAPVLGDLAAMPHLLIAGATGSGKSVCMNTIICSLLFRAKPNEVKFIMIDPKRVEFAAYEGLPHLITPVVTDPKKAAGGLKWALREMENRYALFNTNRVKNLEGYNALVKDEIDRLPQIVVFIDELSDLMMVAAKDVEECICRLAQMARAAGIHLVIATQRPSVDVITGLIKANIPSRIAFAVSSQIDSRTILDMGGAEKLLGKGDMLYHPVGLAKPLRVQGAFLSEEEASTLIEHCKRQCDPDYVDGVAQPVSNERDHGEIEDELFYEAAKTVITAGQASASMLQRRFRIGYNRAARLIEVLQEKGVVGPADGSRPRQILMTLDNFLLTYPLPENASLFDE